MTTQEIRRVEVVPQTSVVDCLPSVAAEAAEVLGYRVPGTEDNAPTEGRLAAILTALDIAPLNSRDVLRYQVEKRHSEEAKALAEQLMSTNPTRSYTSLSWLTTDIEKYSRPIPAHILLRAVQIKRACPDVRIEIEYLGRDPFLLVSIQTGKYSWERETLYVDVWDEPAFEATVRW